MQKRNQDFIRNQGGIFQPAFKTSEIECPVPTKRLRMTHTPERDSVKTSVAAIPNQNEHTFETVRKSPSISPEIRQETSTVGMTRPTPSDSFAEKRCDTTICNNSGTTISPSIEHDDLDKRSAFREVTRSRHDVVTSSCTNQINRENILQQTNNNKYIQPHPCASLYADYPYLRNSFLPMTIPPRSGATISPFSSLQDAARWQHAGAAANAAAHYASYYHQLSAPKPVDLKTESERYMETLIARERAQAESFAIRCAMDKSALPLSPTFGRRVATDPLVPQPTNLLTFAAHPKDPIDPNRTFPWAQRQLVSNAVFPLSSSVIDLPSENWCAKCNASFRMTSDLVYHMRTHHKRSGPEEPEGKRREEKLKCSICNETFRERHHLTRHMTSHVNG